MLKMHQFCVKCRTWLVVVVIVACFIEVATLSGPNVCTVKQKYNITKRVKHRAPVAVRTYVWCFSVPPRCSVWNTEMREMTKLETEEKTAEVAVCCPGYKMKDGSCIPICPNGKTGRDCSEDCPANKWGPNCVEECEPCDNGLCSAEDGVCDCDDGWQGESCELSMSTTQATTTTTATTAALTKKPTTKTPFTTNTTPITKTVKTTTEPPSTVFRTSGMQTNAMTTPLYITTVKGDNETVIAKIPIATITIPSTTRLSIVERPNKNLTEVISHIISTKDRNEEDTINNTNAIEITTTNKVPTAPVNAVNTTNLQNKRRRTENEKTATTLMTETTQTTKVIRITNYPSTTPLPTSTEPTTSSTIKEVYEKVPTHSTAANSLSTIAPKILTDAPKRTEATTRLTTVKFKPKEIWIKPAQKGEVIEPKKIVHDTSKPRSFNDNPNTTPKTIIVSIIPTSVSYVTFKRIALTTASYLAQKQNSTISHKTEGFTNPISMITVTPAPKKDTPVTPKSTKITTVKSKDINSMIETTVAPLTKTNKHKKETTNTQSERNATINIETIMTTENPEDEDISHILTEPEHITAVMADKEMGKASLDLFSVVSIAVGIMIVVITVAVVIVMIDRCRRPSYDEVRKNDVIDNDEAPPPYVRSIFHSPLPDLPSSGACHYQPISTLDRSLKQFMRPVVVQSISPIMLENFRDILECHYDHLPRRSHNLSIDGRCSLAPSMTCCTELHTNNMADSVLTLKREARLDIIDHTTSEPLYAEIPCWRPPSEHAVEILNMNGEAVTEL